MGDIVRVVGRNTIGRVAAVRRSVNGHSIGVEVEGVLSTFIESDLELQEGDPQTPEFWLSSAPASAEMIARTLSWTKIRYPLSDFLYSYAATRTVFKPYQFLPALKILAGSTGRILIADEVGLGKTIEAGLIWTELEQRSPIRRGLIVVPSALVPKWEREMRERFMRPLSILTKANFAAFINELRAGRDPDFIGIVSLHSLRSYGDVISELMSLRPRFDAVIVDEAHALRNRGTKTAAVGEMLADLADHLLFLSATPLNLGSNDLFNLMHMLDPAGYPDPGVFEAQLEPNHLLNKVSQLVSEPATRATGAPREALIELPKREHGRVLTQRSEYKKLQDLLAPEQSIGPREVVQVRRLTNELNTLSTVLNRTRKVDVQEKKALRVVENIEVEWTPSERALYEEIEEFYLERARSRRQPLGFVTQMPLRQASSCLPVARDRFLQRTGWLGKDERDSEYWALDEEILLEESEPASAELRERVIRPQSRDSKLEALRARLRKLRDNQADGVMPKVLLFSFFRGTVEYLVNELAKEFRTGYLHGGVPAKDREQVMDGFRDGDVDILIANQVGSEGLDFQFCHVLVNYDLPWNPMQIEQRIGRLDRIGQRSEKIFILNMSIPGTIETEIIQRLYHRINLFERSIGDLEPIMRQTMDGIERLLLDSNLTPEQRAQEIERQAQVVERNKADVEMLEENSGLLTSVGMLEIDGLTASGPDSGRFVGPSEVASLVDYVMSKYRARISPERDGTVVLNGNATLAVAMNRAVANSGAGSVFGTDFVRRLRDGESILASFHPIESRTDVDLLSSRHPLVRLAVKELAEDPLARPQYGRVKLRNGARSLLALVTLVESTGLTELREFWVTALDVVTEQRDLRIENDFLVALANGGFQSITDAEVDAPRLRRHVTRLFAAEAQRLQDERQLREPDNAALVDARIISQEQTLGFKITKTRTILGDAIRERQDDRIIRMQRGRLANLEAELDRVRTDLEPKRKYVMSARRMAIIEVIA
ncbi:SNF2-related protein [Microbacterium profundi]|uniref:DEAD/DEAH box helicase n=1 Tax=Microbacterium profundi TaxID=450380 RepID=UPI0027DFF6A4|nr:helicase-related protein [Microbacterium profundi]MCE7483500.1 SNF2-related protein [Microbacterium profundi]